MDEDTYTRAVATPSGPALINVTATAEAVIGRVSLSDSRDLELVCSKIRRLLDLDADPDGHRHPPRHRPRARPPGHRPARLALAWRRGRLRDRGPRDHRPHHDYGAHRDAWAAELHVDPPTAKQMNRTLHGERMAKGTRRRRFHETDWNDLPDGTFVLANQVPALVSDSHLVEWTEEGYRTRRPRPVHGQAEVITPPSTVAVLRHGYPVQIDEEAQPARQG